MKISKTESNGQVTLKLDGCLDTAATPQFADELEAAAGAASVVLDVSGLEFIASSALRVLVSTKKRRGADYPIVIQSPNEVVREVFDVTGLDEVFEIK